MKISGVRQTKGFPPEKAEDVVQSSYPSANVDNVDGGASDAIPMTGSNATVENSGIGSGSVKMSPVRKSKGSAEQPKKQYETPDNTQDQGERPGEKNEVVDTN